MDKNKVIFNCPGIYLEEIVGAVEQLPENPYGNICFSIRPGNDKDEFCLNPLYLEINEREYQNEFKLPNSSNNIKSNKEGDVSFDYGGCKYHLKRKSDDNNSLNLFFTHLIKSREKPTG
ncbi:MAG: hypothetical protein WC438_03490 [Candidatus Pacearchaeota archaeon]